MDKKEELNEQIKDWVRQRDMLDDMIDEARLEVEQIEKAEQENSAA